MVATCIDADVCLRELQCNATPKNCIRKRMHTSTRAYTYNTCICICADGGVHAQAGYLGLRTYVHAGNAALDCFLKAFLNCEPAEISQRAICDTVYGYYVQRSTQACIKFHTTERRYHI